ncbi:TRAP transporter small permease [Tardiphaga sp. 71_E8_N1_1]|uniref:TRAP transporter small permease n=1 Tax=Tardiphaga sp. 71_E8_N1_1 TaxID=3240784 RepID=UPI003F894613
MNDDLKEAVVFGPVGNVLLGICKVVACIGGLVMVGITCLSIVSIVGRKLAATPIQGDVEILQMIAAPAIACFFAYCHMIGGDVKVDFIAERFSKQIQDILDGLGSFLLALVAALLAWRTGAGAVALHESGETSALLAWPMWISQALLVPGFALQAIVGLYMSFRHITNNARRVS